MNETDFWTAVKRTRCDPNGRATTGAWFALVQGEAPMTAAAAAGVDVEAVRRTIRRLRSALTTCPHCGRGYEQE